MKSTSLLKETARFALNKEYGFAPAIEDIEISNYDGSRFDFKVGGHEYSYTYRSDNESPLFKKDGNEKNYREQAMMYFDKWLAKLA